MKEKRTLPTFILESSWEVCNKVGGIYTVLSTKAKTMQDTLNDKIVFIGPDFWAGKENPLFLEDTTLWNGWVNKIKEENLNVRVGRWNIPGKPLVVLVDFNPFFAQRDQLYADAWGNYGVDSLHGYGDYDEANMFSYAAARIVESFYHEFLEGQENVVYQAHEWMTCMGALYIQKAVPQIATIFTTHATSIGRSIAGNGKPLYDYLWAYNGTQMSKELNIEAKHSLERQTAHHVDCFTTVSDVTGRECKELLDKECDAILMNGFEADFVPKGVKFTNKRKAARKRIFKVANALTGHEFSDKTLIVATSGRYEFKNKGIDVFIQAMRQCLDKVADNDQEILALIQVPGWVAGPRVDLQSRLDWDGIYDTALDNPLVTHDLNDAGNDQVMNMLRGLGIDNAPESKVKVIFAPCYLDGKDGIFQMPYYDLLIGNDLAVYPSYYEPWGYTPLEAIAFHVPCVTTSLSGFGMWAETVKGAQSHIEDGVEVISRNDYNNEQVAQSICDTLLRYAAYTDKERDAIRKKAAALSKKALWKNFYAYYLEAYDIAIKHAKARMAANEI